MGATYQGQPVGSFGDIAAFSLQFQKVLTAGEGGLIATNSTELYERAIRCHDHGGFRAVFAEKYGLQPTLDHFFSENYRMSELTGAVALVQVKRLEQLISNMRKNKRAIKAGLKKISGFEFRQMPDETGDIGVALSFYVKHKAMRDEFISRIAAEGIPLLTCYSGLPIYLKNPQFQNVSSWHWKNYPFSAPEMKQNIPSYKKGIYPICEDLLDREAHLYPISPFFDKSDCEQIVDAFYKVATSF